MVGPSPAGDTRSSFALLYLVGIWCLAGPLVLVPLTILGCVGLLAVLTGRRVRDAGFEGRTEKERAAPGLLFVPVCGPIP